MNSNKFTKTKTYLCGGAAFFAAALLFSSGPTAAQDDTGSASAEALLDEIIVSARRREERLLDQPMSISAITGEQMQVQGIYSIDQASKFVPNVTLTTDATGHYAVTGLVPGQYRIVETDQPAGFFDGLDSAGHVAGESRGSALNPGDGLDGILLQGGDAAAQYSERHGSQAQPGTDPNRSTHVVQAPSRARARRQRWGI